jgi:transposase
VDAQKKTLGATERDEEARGAWRRRYGGVDPRRFVFVDESSTNVRMVPLRARSPKGQRAFGKAPKNWEKNVTLICSISLLEGMGPSMSIEGSADGEAFALYVEHFLCPELKDGQIVVMDNLQVHKSKRVRELIEGRGCSLVFLPSYSPDFNPIEEAFSKVKALLRKAKARSFEALVEATGGALSLVSERDALGFFAHCGYAAARGHSI